MYGLWTVNHFNGEVQAKWLIFVMIVKVMYFIYFISEPVKSPFLSISSQMY